MADHRSHRVGEALPPAVSPRKASLKPGWLWAFKPSPAEKAAIRDRLAKAAQALPAPLGRIGGLELRLAERPKDVKRAQRLRYRVFFEEMSAAPDAFSRLARRDIDPFDAVCDHLLVYDRAKPKGGFSLAKLMPGLKGIEVAPGETESARKPKVVGTYRLLRQTAAEAAFGFYTANEFDIGPLVARHRGLSFLELGRSCVLKPYRDKRTVELLWHGIWAYVLAHRVDVMIGCASLEGVDPEKLRLALSYLHHFHAAPPEWSAKALPERRARFDLIPKDEIDQRKALKALPPLIKGYLRVGAYIGEGAVIDRQFGTTDVLIILPKTAINPRYVDHYGADASRYAA
jgi:putative hemolysin